VNLACSACPVRETAACAVLTPEERSAMASAGRTRTLERGEMLFAAGDEDAACATLLSGALKVSAVDQGGNEQILALVHPAGFIGELFAPFAHHDVTALTHSRLCTFAKADIERAIEDYPALARALLRRSQADLLAALFVLALGGMALWQGATIPVTPLFGQVGPTAAPFAVGGLLLLWVCWKMWRELQEQRTHDQAEAEAELETALSAHHGGGPPPEALGIKRKTFGAALLQIMIADVTMSLDNVLAVAGAAHEHPWIMVFGLVLSIALMGLAATFIAKLLTKHRWIGYVGLVIVLYVALHMIWDGARSVIVRTDRMDAFNAAAPGFLDISQKEAAKHLKGVAPDETAIAAPPKPSSVTDVPPPLEVSPAG